MSRCSFVSYSTLLLRVLHFRSFHRCFPCVSVILGTVSNDDSTFVTCSALGWDIFTPSRFWFPCRRSSCPSASQGGVPQILHYSPHHTPTTKRSRRTKPTKCGCKSTPPEQRKKHQRQRLMHLHKLHCGEPRNNLNKVKLLNAFNAGFLHGPPMSPCMPAQGQVYLFAQKRQRWHREDDWLLDALVAQKIKCEPGGTPIRLSCAATAWALRCAVFEDRRRFRSSQRCPGESNDPIAQWIS